MNRREVLNISLMGLGGIFLLPKKLLGWFVSEPEVSVANFDIPRGNLGILSHNGHWEMLMPFHILDVEAAKKFMISYFQKKHPGKKCHVHILTRQDDDDYTWRALAVSEQRMMCKGSGPFPRSNTESFPTYVLSRYSKKYRGKPEYGVDCLSQKTECAQVFDGQPIWVGKS